MNERGLRGFILPVVLVLLACAALLLADAGSLGAQASALAGRDALRLRAFEAAEAGLLLAGEELKTHAIPRTHRRLERGDGLAVDVELHLDRIDTLAEGHSAGRVRLERYRIQSIARGPRGSQQALELGLTRVITGGAG